MNKINANYNNIFLPPSIQPHYHGETCGRWWLWRVELRWAKTLGGHMTSKAGGYLSRFMSQYPCKTHWLSVTGREQRRMNWDASSVQSTRDMEHSVTVPSHSHFLSSLRPSLLIMWQMYQSQLLPATDHCTYSGEWVNRLLIIKRERGGGREGERGERNRKREYVSV